MWYTSLMNFYQKVYKFVKTVPKGKVVTYGRVAAACGSPRASRSVGAALHRNPSPGVVPCHRVVFADGSLAPGFAFGGKEAQMQLLKKEGVTFIDDKVNMQKHELK